VTTAELARGRAGTSGYLHANAAFDDELGRLRLLEARYDARTFARLSMFGPLAGTRCLEVGAGAGSVARWLAAQVGSSGQVVATDTNPRFLAGAHRTGVEVRRHDILTDPLEPGHYDLVHCRALLLHLAAPLPSGIRMCHRPCVGGVNGLGRRIRPTLTGRARRSGRGTDGRRSGRGTDGRPAG
jgi:SAM-dependent methyltransferase